MTLLITIAFLLAVTGSMLLLNLSPFTFLEGISKLKPENKSLRRRIQRSKKNKQPKGLKLLLIETKELLNITGKGGMFTGICILAMMMFIVGVLIAISMRNLYLVPVLAVGFSLLPFYYIRIVASRYKKLVRVELETALSIITTSYLRGKHTIIKAIEENQPYLNPSAAEVFRNFLMQTKLINSNLEEGLENLKTGINDLVFHEWVDTLIACQNDYNLKVTLPAIVSKLSDMRVVSAELDVLLYDPIKEYITMVVLLFGSIPLMYILNKDWYKTLMFTEFGKILLSICGIAVFVSIGAVAKHTRPIQYRR